jgi:hypothetical protein
MHAIANGLVFDYYCHLHHDLLAPGGPIRRPAPQRTDDAVRAAVEWMMLGLPQMQGDALTAAFGPPLVLDLSGPGAGQWTVARPDPAGPPVVTEGADADTVVSSDTHSFVAWGTKRRGWRRDCTVTGDEAGVVASRRLEHRLNLGSSHVTRPWRHQPGCAGSTRRPHRGGIGSWLAADLDESAFVGEDDELGAVACAEFHHGPVDVGLDGEG